MTAGRRVDQLPRSVEAITDFLKESTQKEWERLTGQKSPPPLPSHQATKDFARQILERVLAAGEL